MRPVVALRVAALAAVAGCLPPAGFETARVTPPGEVAVTAGGELAATFGRRHDYQLRSESGELSSASTQHQPFGQVEAGVLGRSSLGLLPGVELELAGYNPLIFPPVGLGALAGAKVQLLCRGRLAVALGARAGGYLHLLGGSGNERFWALGLLEARAVVSADLSPGLTITITPRYQLEAIRDRLTDADEGGVDFVATSRRGVPAAALGLALGEERPTFIDIGLSLAPETGDDPDFARLTVGVARRM